MPAPSFTIMKGPLTSRDTFNKLVLWQKRYYELGCVDGIDALRSWRHIPKRPKTSDDPPNPPAGPPDGVLLLAGVTKVSRSYNVLTIETVHQTLELRCESGACNGHLCGEAAAKRWWRALKVAQQDLLAEQKDNLANVLEKRGPLLWCKAEAAAPSAALPPPPAQTTAGRPKRKLPPRDREIMPGSLPLVYAMDDALFGAPLPRAARAAIAASLLSRDAADGDVGRSVGVLLASNGARHLDAQGEWLALAAAAELAQGGDAAFAPGSCASECAALHLRLVANRAGVAAFALLPVLRAACRGGGDAAGASGGAAVATVAGRVREAAAGAAGPPALRAALRVFAATACAVSTSADAAAAAFRRCAARLLVTQVVCAAFATPMEAAALLAAAESAAAQAGGDDDFAAFSVAWRERAPAAYAEGGEPATQAREGAAGTLAYAINEALRGRKPDASWDTARDPPAQARAKATQDAATASALAAGLLPVLEASRKSQEIFGGTVTVREVLNRCTAELEASQFLELVEDGKAKEAFSAAAFASMEASRRQQTDGADPILTYKSVMEADAAAAAAKAEAEANAVPAPLSGPGVPPFEVLCALEAALEAAASAAAAFEAPADDGTPGAAAVRAALDGLGGAFSVPGGALASESAWARWVEAAAEGAPAPPTEDPSLFDERVASLDGDLVTARANLAETVNPHSLLEGTITRKKTLISQAQETIADIEKGGIDMLENRATELARARSDVEKETAGLAKKEVETAKSAAARDVIKRDIQRLRTQLSACADEVYLRERCAAVGAYRRLRSASEDAPPLPPPPPSGDGAVAAAWEPYLTVGDSAGTQKLYWHDRARSVSVWELPGPFGEGAKAFLAGAAGEVDDAIAAFAVTEVVKARHDPAGALWLK